MKFKKILSLVVALSMFLATVPVFATETEQTVEVAETESVSAVNVATSDELAKAITDAENGNIVRLTADIEYGSVLVIDKDITLDLGGKTLTTTNGWGCLQLKSGAYLTNGKLVHNGNVAAIKVWDSKGISDVEIEVAYTENKIKGGIVLQENCAGVDVLKNVTIKGEGLTNGIETYNCGNATENVIGSMENVTIDAVGTGMLISAPCGTATNCTINGDVTGIELWIKGTYSAKLDLADCDVTGGLQAVYVHDEFSSNPDIENTGELTLTVDDATTFASETGEVIAMTIARAENVNIDESLQAHLAPKGENSYAYTKEVDGYVRVWGEGGGNASESFELKLYSGDTHIATTKLNNIDGIIDGDVYVTWNFFYPESNDAYWTTKWEEGHPNALAQPTKVELIIDGVVVCTTDAKMSGADDVNPVVWEELGGVKKVVTGLSGAGTENDPYLINNLEELKWFRDYVNTFRQDGASQYAGKFIKLTADIDLDEDGDGVGEEWTPIGSTTKDHGSFYGNFDGDGHTISNLVVSKHGTGSGFFAKTSGGGDGPQAVIRNLNFKNVDVDAGNSNSYAGGVIANSGGNTVISNVHVTGNVYVNGYGYVGGIIGHGYPKIDNCSVKVEEGSYIHSNYWSVGGILGYGGEGNGATKITNCEVSGLEVWGAYGGAASVCGNPRNGAIGENLVVKNCVISGDDYALGYVFGNDGGNLTNVICENVVLNGMAADAVAIIGSNAYFDLKSAFASVSDGQTIKLIAKQLSEGTVLMPARLKNVTIKSEIGTVLKDMAIQGADGNTLVYEGLTFDGLIFDNSRIAVTGWRNGEESYKDWTINNCIFKNLDDTTNSAPIHINLEEESAIINFTFTNNTIDGAVGGSKSGLYAQLTGNILIENNVINNVAFRPYVIQVTTDDGISDNFIVKGNTFSGTPAGRAQGLGNNAEGTDAVTLAVTENIFKDIKDSQQICYWNFNMENTTADISRNYYDINLEENPGKIYFNKAAESADELLSMGVYPIYTELNEDGTINKESEYTYKRPWDGVTISTLEELKKFRDRVNEGDTYNGKTVTLTCDINLDEDGDGVGEEWTPIKQFNGIFDGQEHTISNLVVNGGTKSNQGFFGQTNNGEIKNVTFNNANVSGRLNVGVVAGTPYTSKYTNINIIDHVEVNGMSYVGGVGGKNAYANWTNITVDVDETSYVKADSVENGIAYRTYVGGVIGFIGEGGHKFENITSNIDVIGSTCDIGGITGIAHYGNKFVNVKCTSDVTCEAADETEIGGIAGTWHNQDGTVVTAVDCLYDGTITIAGKTAPSVPFGSAYNATGTGALDATLVEAVAAVGVNKYATLAEAVKVAKTGDTIIIYPGTYTEGLSVKSGVSMVGIGEVKLGGKLSVSGDSVYVKNIDVETSGDAFCISGNGTIEDCEFKGNNGARYCYANNGDVTFKNCVITGSTYGVHFDAGSGEGNVILDGCSVTGWTSFGSAVEHITIKNSVFNKGNYNYIRLYQGATIENCTFNEEMGLDIADSIEATVKVNSSTVENGSVERLFDNTDIDRCEIYVDEVLLANPVAKIGDTLYATLAEALKSAETMTGDVTITLLGDVEWETGAAHGSTPLISENANATSVTIDGQNLYSFTATGAGVGPIRSAAKDTVLGFKNLIINDKSVSYAEGAWEFTYLEMGGKLNVENCNFTSGIMVSGDVAFTECSFQPNPTASNEYSVWVDDGNATFTSCKFTGNRALKIHEAYGTEISAVTVDKCTFTDITAKPGIVIGDLNTDTKVTVSETTMNNVKAGDQGMYLYESDTQISGFTFNVDDKTFVYENNVQVYPKMVAEVTGSDGTSKSYDSLNKAITATQKGETVTIITDGTYKLPSFSKDITIKAADGVNATFDDIGKLNLSASNVTFENITFDYYPNVNYTGLQHTGNLTYNNCTFNGQVFLYGTSETFNNCTFNQNSADAYNVWTYSANKVDFNNCTLNSAGKSVLVYNEGACKTDATFTDCTFAASVPVEGKAAIEIDTTLMPDGTDIVINNCTATGFATGSVSGNSLWNDKKDQKDLTVTVDDVKVWPAVAQIGEIWNIKRCSCCCKGN